MIRGHSDCHHPVEGEVEQCEVHEEQVPEELGGCPLKINHGIDNYPI